MKKTKKQWMKISKLLLCLAGVLWLVVCNTWSSRHRPDALERDYGNSVRSNLAQSILNPRAGLNDTPAVGLGPNASLNAMERYDKSFKGEEKKSTEMKANY
jgi:hypothetical protein